MGKTLRLIVAALPVALTLSLLLAHASGLRLLVVEGGSMQPSLKPGDLVVVEPLPQGEMRKGEVIAWKDGQGGVIHRIESIRGSGSARRFKTRGDANRVGDIEPRSSLEARGRVALVLPRLGLAVAALRTPAGFFLGVLLPAGVLLVSFFRDLLSSTRVATVVPARSGSPVCRPSTPSAIVRANRQRR